MEQDLTLTQLIEKILLESVKVIRRGKTIDFGSNFYIVEIETVSEYTLYPQILIDLQAIIKGVAETVVPEVREEKVDKEKSKWVIKDRASGISYFKVVPQEDRCVRIEVTQGRIGNYTAKDILDAYISLLNEQYGTKPNLER